MFKLWQLSLLVLAGLMSACSPPVADKTLGDPQFPYHLSRPPQVGDVLHMPTGYYVSDVVMLSILDQSRIIYVGETHDNMASHRLQLQILKSMVENDPGEVALGLEMFTPEQQETLDRWVAGDLTEKEFLKEAGWYSQWRMDFDYYRDILIFAREHGIPVIGLNAPKSLVKKVSADPLEALDEETRASLPEMDLTDPYQKALTEAIYGGHQMGDAALEGFLRVQTLWDETMAENIADYLTSPEGLDKRMMVMAGGNHIRHGFGIPRRVFRRLPTSYVLTGNREIEIPEDKQERLMDVETPQFPMVPYDFIAFTSYEDLDKEKVRLGVMLDDEEGKVRLSGVMPDSVAQKVGLQKDDVILEIDGEQVTENFDVIYAVKQKQPGDTSTLTIERGEELLEFEITYEAAPDQGHGHGGKE